MDSTAPRYTDRTAVCCPPLTPAGNPGAPRDATSTRVCELVPSLLRSGYLVEDTGHDDVISIQDEATGLRVTLLDKESNRLLLRSQHPFHSDVPTTERASIARNWNESLWAKAHLDETGGLVVTHAIDCAGGVHIPNLMRTFRRFFGLCAFVHSQIEHGANPCNRHKHGEVATDAEGQSPAAAECRIASARTAVLATDSLTKERPRVADLLAPIEELLQASPDARRLAMAFVDWIRVVLTAQESLPASFEADVASPEQEPALQVTDAVSEEDRSTKGPLLETKPVDSDSEALLAGQQAVLARWANPDISPKITVAPQTVKARTSEAANRNRFDCARCRRRIALHHRVLSWAIACARHGFDSNGAEHRELLVVAEREQVFFWEMNRLVRNLSANEWHDIRELYTAVEEALQLALDAPRAYFHTARVFRLVADAAQALHSRLEYVRRLGLFDNDLDELYRYCQRHPDFGNVLPRTQVVEDPFDLPAFRARLKSTRTEIHQKIANEKAPCLALKKLDYHLGQIRKDPTNAEAQSRSICDALQAWVDTGSPLDDPRLLSRFSTTVSADALPEGVHAHLLGAQLVAILERAHADEVDEAEQDDESVTPIEDREDWIGTPAIRAARGALRGKRVVIIGGDERRQRKRAIEKAFELEELEWVATRPHEKHDGLITAIQNPRTALVLLLIRWSSHSYGEMSKVCAELGTPLVRLPAGYSPAMIAREVVEQAGARLGIVETKTEVE